jgi:quercetin 2,3-dioxygenase
MITLRPAAERGHANHGWLDSHHSFSFADYYDPRHMGFRALRVINEDRVAPGRGFPSHPHRDMEIVSYVLEGALEHKDSIGTGSVIRPGDVQRMSAGSGVVHSEYNASRDEPVHFLQIWLLPERRNLPPGYEQKSFSEDEKRGRLRVVASRDGRDGSVTVHQDVTLYATQLSRSESVVHQVSPGRHVYVQVARGAVDLDGQMLLAGDGAMLSDASSLTLSGASDGSETLLFDLA